MFGQLTNYKVVLGSQSPRRQELLKGLGITFEVVTANTDESFDPALQRQEIPLYLSQKKARHIQAALSENYLLITSDTVVWIGNEVLNKPQSREEALNMLSKLSGKTHEVFTAVTLTTASKMHSFYEQTKVTFKVLTLEEMEFYIDTYKPFDKAGSYGVQEWLGYIAITKIEGCFFNVMGLPLSRLYQELNLFK